MAKIEVPAHNVSNDLQARLNSIMGYLKQIQPENFNTQKSSSEYLKINRTNLSAALNGDSRYLKPDSPVINAIFLKFPELSKEWFHEGSGEMLKSKERIEIESKGISPNVMNISIDEFDKLATNQQLSLLWQAIHILNENMQNKMNDQHNMMIKVVDFIDEKVTPMYEFMKLNSKKK